MYCKNCGATLEDHMAFCPYCSTPNATMPKPQSESNSNGAGYMNGNISGAKTRTYLVRGLVGVAAAILATVAVLYLVKLVGTIEDAIAVFSTYDAVAAAGSTAGFIACDLILAGCAALAAMPIAQSAFNGNGLGRTVIDRSMATAIAFIIISIAVWICKLVFRAPTGGTISVALYIIFSTFGDMAMKCLVPAIVAVAILYIVRSKLLTSAGVRY